MKDNILIIHPRDNVAIALTALAAGDRVSANGATVMDAVDCIPASHKIALYDIPAGEAIIKYGEPVAVSTQNIRRGQWVHIHNLESRRWKK